MRVDDKPPTIYFTTPMLDSFSAAQLLAVILQLLERYKLMHSNSQAVLEADSRTLLITRDPDAILSAIRLCLLDRFARVARFEDREAWFSDDEGIPEPGKDTTLPRDPVDRERELRRHLGAMGLEE